MGYYLVQANQVTFEPSGVGVFGAQLDIVTDQICLRCPGFPNPEKSEKRLKEYFGEDLITSPDKRKMYVQISTPTKNPSKLRLKITGAALKLLDVFFGPKLRLGLEICNAMLYLPCGTPTGALQSFRTTNMQIEPRTLLDYTSKDVFAFPEEWNMPWRQLQGKGGKIRGRVNLVLSGDTGSVRCRTKTDNEFAAYCKKILQRDLKIIDVEIICENDTKLRIGCQQDILIAQSEAFKRMLLVYRLKEIVMRGMSWPGVKASIWCLYSGDLKIARESCAVAVELLLAGHKYLVSRLGKDVKEILIERKICWFDVESTLTLFGVSREVESLKDLKERALEVLKAMPREVKGSDVLAKLFHEKPDAALELFRTLLLD